MKKVLITEPINQQGIQILRQETQVTIKEGLTEQDLREIIPIYHALIIRSKTQVTPAIIKEARELKVIGRAGVGVDNIDLEMATRKGVVVLNAPRGNTIAAAEHTLALMLSLARNIPHAHLSLKEGVWNKKDFLGVELYQKTLGILGLGQIGCLVAKRVQALGMKTIAFDPYIHQKQAQKMGVELLALEEVLKRADFLTIHTPKTKKTYHLIGPKELSLMKDGCRLVNCARGGIIDEDALYHALEKGQLAGAALDVFEEEPEGFERFSPLKNVILTPHLGASTKEAQENVALDIAKEVLQILKGKVSSCTVNIPFTPYQDYESIKEYLPLAYQMGRLYRQTQNGAQNRIQILYRGPIGNYNTSLLTNTLLQGILTDTTDEFVNQINAPLIAKERGIRVVESKNSSSPYYTNLISLLVEENGDPFEISGTLFDKNEPRIVKLDHYTIDLKPTENMLFIKHLDIPGMIGQVGSILGEKGINIAGMLVGREEVGGNAIMVLQLDTPLPQDLIIQIEKIPSIKEARIIHL